MNTTKHQPVMLKEVSYLKIDRPQTLKQFIVNKFMTESNSNAHVKGTVKVDGNLMPKSAKSIQDTMKGMTAEKIIEIHPEWENDYPAYLEEWKNKRAE